MIRARPFARQQKADNRDYTKLEPAIQFSKGPKPCDCLKS